MSNKFNDSTNHSSSYTEFSLYLREDKFFGFLFFLIPKFVSPVIKLFYVLIPVIAELTDVTSLINVKVSSSIPYNL